MVIYVYINFGLLPIPAAHEGVSADSVGAHDLPRDRAHATGLHVHYVISCCSSYIVSTSPTSATGLGTPIGGHALTLAQAPTAEGCLVPAPGINQCRPDYETEKENFHFVER